MPCTNRQTRRVRFDQKPGCDRKKIRRVSPSSFFHSFLLALLSSCFLRSSFCSLCSIYSSSFPLLFFFLSSFFSLLLSFAFRLFASSLCLLLLFLLPLLFFLISSLLFPSSLSSLFSSFFFLLSPCSLPSLLYSFFSFRDASHRLFEQYQQDFEFWLTGSESCSSRNSRFTRTISLSSGCGP